MEERSRVGEGGRVSTVGRDSSEKRMVMKVCRGYSYTLEDLKGEDYMGVEEALHSCFPWGVKHFHFT
jgi:hypothetical protein